MIVIDLDAVKTPKGKAYVISAVKKTLVVKQRMASHCVYKASTPIYWFTRKKCTIDQLSSMGYPQIGTMWTVESVISGLRAMVTELDSVVKGMDMAPTGMFRKPVFVFTDERLGEIERLGATPLPAQIFNKA